jgi:hypothetical protein
MPTRATLSLCVISLVLSACSARPAQSDSIEAYPTVPPSFASASTPGEPSQTDSVAPDAPVVDGPIEVGDWVMTTADRLKVRATPGLTGHQSGLLALATTATVIAGPVIGDGYPWYQLVWAGLPYGTGCTEVPPDEVTESCWGPGWVAGADANGASWLARAPLECPPSPTTVGEASRVQPGVAVQCFGEQGLSLLGFLAPSSEGRGCWPGYDVTPATFHPCSVVIVDDEETPFDGTTPSITITVDSDLGACALDWRTSQACPLAELVGRWVVLNGHYDDPEAASCVATPWEDEGVSPDPAVVVYECRFRFVVVDVQAAEKP